MAAGLGLLRLPPAQFWSMTPRELAAALRGVAGVSLSTPPQDRAVLDALIARYPDIT